MEAYHLLGPVGEGSFGQVFKGRQRKTGEVMALKFIPKMGKSERDLRSLRREIEIMKNLKHPNIVELNDSFETENEIVVVTEFAEGQLFQILTDDGKLTETKMHEIACQLISALHYLHNHRILHRDMKPQNILLGKNRMVKLCDFGFARCMSVSTLVLTSIKGTPLYMSPELIQEKPYDHTADLWSLGCILFELLTGAPPFYTSSMFELVHLIMTNTIKWPDNMSPLCMDFLQGLLTKDPEERLSWPDLLHHPFVAGSVQVMPDLNTVSPLTVTPTPDEREEKNRQKAEKAAARQQRRLLQRFGEHGAHDDHAAGDDQDADQDGDDEQDVHDTDDEQDADDADDEHEDPDAHEHESSQSSTDFSELQGAAGGYNGISTTSSSCGENSSSDSDCSYTSIPMSFPPHFDLYTRQRGQISIDYEKEFRVRDVGPKTVWKWNSYGVTRPRNTIPSIQEYDSVPYWKKLSQDTAAKIPPYEQAVYIVPRIKTKIKTFQTRFDRGTARNLELLYYPMLVLRNLLMTRDPEMFDHIISELQLPWLLFDLAHNCVGRKAFVQNKLGIRALAEMIIALFVLMEKYTSWVADECSVGELIQPFMYMLSSPRLYELGPLAASILYQLSTYTHVTIPMEYIVSALRFLLLGYAELQLPPPPGQGLCDGLFNLLLGYLHQNDIAPVPECFTSVLFADLWKKVSLSLVPRYLSFYSVNGLHTFMAVTLSIFTKDPHASILLFNDPVSNALGTLIHLVGNKCNELFTEGNLLGTPLLLVRENLSSLSCLLLCFPFSLGLPNFTISSLVHTFDKFGIIPKLLQAIQSCSVPQLELPITLMSRLMTANTKRFLGQLIKEGIFLTGPDNQPTAIQGSSPKTIHNLLPVFMSGSFRMESATEILTISACVAGCAQKFKIPPLYVKAEMLPRGVVHHSKALKFATCKLLAHLDPFTLPLSYSKQLFLFKGLIKSLTVSDPEIRRASCTAVGNWLGCVLNEMERKSGVTDLSFFAGRGDGSVGAVRGQAVSKPKVSARLLMKWVEEGFRSIDNLISLFVDPDDVTRCGAFVAIGRLIKLDGGVALMLEHDVAALLTERAQTDPSPEVRNAAAKCLSECNQHYDLFQVLACLDAFEDLSVF